MRRLVGSEPAVPNSGTHWVPKGAKMSFLLPMVTDRMRLSYEADMQTKPWFGLKNEGGSRFPWPESCTPLRRRSAICGTPLRQGGARC